MQKPGTWRSWPCGLTAGLGEVGAVSPHGLCLTCLTVHLPEIHPWYFEPKHHCFEIFCTILRYFILTAFKYMYFEDFLHLALHLWFTKCIHLIILFPTLSPSLPLCLSLPLSVFVYLFTYLLNSKDSIKQRNCCSGPVAGEGNLCILTRRENIWRRCHLIFTKSKSHFIMKY